MKRGDNFNKNLDALLAQKEETSKKLESLRKELQPLMLKDYNTNEELIKMNDLLTKESKLINEDHEISMQLLDSLGKDIDSFEEELKTM